MGKIYMSTRILPVLSFGYQLQVRFFLLKKEHIAWKEEIAFCYMLKCNNFHLRNFKLCLGVLCRISVYAICT